MLEIVNAIKNYNKFEEIENFKNNEISKFTFERSKLEKIRNYFLGGFFITLLLSFFTSFSIYYQPIIFIGSMVLFFIGFSLSFFNLLDKKIVLPNIKNEYKKGIFTKYVFYKKAFKDYIDSLNEEELYVFNYNYKISDKIYCLLKEADNNYILEQQGDILIGINDIINGKVKKDLLTLLRSRTEAQKEILSERLNELNEIAKQTKSLINKKKVL